MGEIFFWFHADNGKPDWNINIFDPIKNDPWYYEVSSTYERKF